MNLNLRRVILFMGISFYFLLSCTEKIPEGPERSEILEVKLLIKEGRQDFSQENNWENRYRIPPRKMSLEEYEYLAQWQVPFGIKIINDFDEAIDGKKWIDIRLNLWSADPNENWRAQLIYADTSSSRYLTIPPGDSLTLYTGNKLTWNQHDMEGKSIHLTDRYTPLWVECKSITSDSLLPDTRPPQYMKRSVCDTVELAPVDTVVAFQGSKKIYARADVQIFKNYHVISTDTVTFNIHYFFPTYGFIPKFRCFEAYFYPWENPCPGGR